MNILNEAAHQLTTNGIALKELVVKYKKELEKIRRDQAAALDRVAMLEEKISEM